MTACGPSEESKLADLRALTLTEKYIEARKKPGIFLSYTKSMGGLSPTPSTKASQFGKTCR